MNKKTFRNEIIYLKTLKKKVNIKNCLSLLREKFHLMIAYFTGNLGLISTSSLRGVGIYWVYGARDPPPTILWKG